jgi:RNA polymerase sigma factor (sigma-70 family)
MERGEPLMPKHEVADVQDSEIVAMLAEHTEDGIRQLLQAHGPRVTWLLRDRFGHVLAEPDLAAVLNEATFKAFRAIGTFDGSKGTLRGWFWQIAANAARNMLRGELRHAHQELRYDPYEVGRRPACLEDEPPAIQALANLREAISSLPELQRKVIEADLASGDIASAAWLARSYSTTEASIYKARSRARENLRKALLSGQRANESGR